MVMGWLSLSIGLYPSDIFDTDSGLFGRPAGLEQTIRQDFYRSLLECILEELFSVCGLKVAIDSPISQRHHKV
jgi:hypothetical protein